MSGVKVTNERPARPITAIESVDGEVDDENVDWDPDTGVGEFDQWKQPAVAATTANITIATALNAGDTIDGVTLASGDRVLVKDQSAAAQNGIYVAGTTPRRAVEMDEDDEVLGAVVYVVAGTANGGTAWAVTNDTATVVGTDAIDWAAFGGGGSGDFLTKIEGGQDTIKAHGSMGATETFDPTDGNVHTGTLDANCTFTLNAPSGSGACLLELRLTQDGTGGWVITWPGSVAVIGTLTTTALTSSIVMVETLDGGTSWVAVVVGAGGSALTVKDEGSSLDTAVTSIDAVGAGVTATNVGHAVTLTIPGTPTGAAGGDLSGTYPNPSVVDDSHSHTAATLPAASSSTGTNHAHVVDEQFSGDASTTVFSLANEAVPESVMAWVAGTRTPVTLGGSMNDQITFGSAPGSGTLNVSVDYAAVSS